MNVNIQTPKKSLNKAFLKVKPERVDIENFKANLTQLLDRINERESEEFHKNIVSSFLDNTYYAGKHYINTKGRTDLVIHNGADAKSTVGVIIEAKKPTNKAEMLSTGHINVKALHELLLYYLQERIKNKNNDIKHIVATNIYEWFIFDAQVFEKLFAQNKELVREFTDFDEGRKSGKTTDFFYKEIAEPFINNIEDEVSFTHFDLRNYEKLLRGAAEANESKLIALFKIFSPQHLLKLPFVNDSNTLDKTFYAELLHIIGLRERKEKNKKLIDRKEESERSFGTLLENAINQLDMLGKITRMSDQESYGSDYNERLFNVGLELCITWINRILFLKLMEAQLISYHKGDKSYAFLNLDKISSFDELNSLFFSVLARQPQERNRAVKEKFEKVPFLNSSLFEPSEIEHQTILISNLNDDRTLPVHPHTVLKDSTGKKISGELTALEYLFRFLDAYDFSSEGQEEIQEENKSLINASVLGLIFEKINGYREGSFFTPGFITMYMCRETIERAVVQKFNDTKGWNCKTFDDLREDVNHFIRSHPQGRKEAREEANEIVNSLKICDPAVGSGHFLVSALNEIIAIKYRLNILQDRDGVAISGYKAEVVNDELIVSRTVYDDEPLFEYIPGDEESQRIQETLFYEKQIIIENCLFGVDINANSVKICRLRLWIELLKNAYYKNETGYKELETLPNIDINIKCGNSLISRFPLDADLGQALKQSKWTVDSYRMAVQTYRNAGNQEEKSEMLKLINSIKNDFRTEISRSSPIQKKLDKLGNELFMLTGKGGKYGTGLMMVFEDEEEYPAKDKNKKKREEKIRNIEKQIETFTAQIEGIKSNKIYNNAFEWRFEFPEVLDDEGKFRGFDVVIGNPPYVLIDNKSKEGIYLTSNYRYHHGKSDLYRYFVEQGHYILKNDGLFSFIMPTSILNIPGCTKLRKFLLNENTILEIINFYGAVFEEASVNNIILFTKKVRTNEPVSIIEDLAFYPTEDSLKLAIKTKKTVYKTKWVKNNDCAIKTNVSNREFDIIEKITINSKKLKDICKYTLGLQVYHNSIHTNEQIKKRIFHSREKVNETYFPETSGRQISRFYFDDNFLEYVSYGDWCYNKPDWNFCSEKRVYVREILSSKGLICAITDNVNIPNKAIIAILPDSELEAEFVLGVMNSKLIKFFIEKTTEKGIQRLFPRISLGTIASLPISIGEINQNQNIVTIVKKIIIAKNINPTADTTDLESQIDRMVYDLYGLTEEEVRVVES
ncbi:MAG: Eco57I restriction-modification methylase domain-containing protein [Bacteroidales bacterium]